MPLGPLSVWFFAAPSRNLAAPRSSPSQPPGGVEGVTMAGPIIQARARPGSDRSAQRARILDAMAEVVAERGVAGASVEAVCARARVSRRTFYACYADAQECVFAVMSDGQERALRALTQNSSLLLTVIPHPPGPCRVAEP